MSQYIYDYDDETHDRWFEVEINYETQEPEFCRCERGAYRNPGQIYITSVRVLVAEYYNPAGDTICTIKREDMHPECIKYLDRDAEAIIEQWVDDGDDICDDLWRNRG